MRGNKKNRQKEDLSALGATMDDHILGFKLYRKKGRYWTAAKSIRGKKHTVYVGVDKNKADEKIRAYCCTYGINPWQLANPEEISSLEVPFRSYPELLETLWTQEKINEDLIKRIGAFENEQAALRIQNERLQKDLNSLKSEFQGITGMVPPAPVSRFRRSSKRVRPKISPTKDRQNPRKINISVGGLEWELRKYSDGKWYAFGSNRRVYVGTEVQSAEQKILAKMEEK